MSIDYGFQRVLDHIRSIAESEAHKGRLFERLMKAYFAQDPLYRDRFSNVWLWHEWARHYPGFDARDTGIDLVAEEREGGYCAIQCKCYAPGTRISKGDLDSFIAASAREPFTARIVVDTGDEWGRTAAKTIASLRTPCTVLRFGDLASRPFDWPDLVSQEPEDLKYRKERFSLRPHQRRALDDVLAGFERDDRGKLIMACGTGKTFAALRIAEKIAGVGGRVLYLVPSISLFAQSMREWATQRGMPHRYVGICSDTRTGYHDEDASVQELEIPVTTSPAKITDALVSEAPEAMTVVFCTYHSLPLVEQAQDGGAPRFDLVLCDEAHRTTGVDLPEAKTSPFVLVHDSDRIRAGKRLYMTATPRIYTEGTKAKAARHDAEVFSMDDEGRYGPEFHRLPFSSAISQKLLSDYKVVILAVEEQQADPTLQAHLARHSSELSINDAAKIVGCWRALWRRRADQDGNGEANRPLTRAIAFSNSIIASQRLKTHWDKVVEQAIERFPEEERAGLLRCETRHVDGRHNALQRKRSIDWLEGSQEGVCRILSNARCLSEGVDVPALDAVFFMAPRRSQVEIVQAVGRVMRSAKGKEYGYIILPVAIPPGTPPDRMLDDNKRWGTVWSVLRALRSHDNRFDAEINRIDLNKEPPDRIIIDGPVDDEQIIIDFPPLDVSPDAIYGKIVDKCGDRKYWETWAKDIADIFARLVVRLNGLLENPEHEALREWFGGFHEELRAATNESLTRDAAVDMVAQHILTRPVFGALFDGYDFAAGNPIGRALEELRRDFAEFGLENEVRDMERFYESVRRRARGLDNSEARQTVLKELYEKFFSTAVKKEADRLGIVYTPTEVVDFILKSADHVLREEFGRGLTDREVHVLDPFTGTGIFLARLLQLAGLVRDADLARKYASELHANELVLLAYYIATVNIEEAYRGRRGEEASYEPFGGIVLTDTFNLNSPQPGIFLSENTERAKRQEEARIEVIVGNPPWSAGQRSSADENPNVVYPELRKRISVTYAARSSATNKNSLYDTYKMAIRWASDRIGKQGVVAFVTNGSWVTGNVDSGVRACLAGDFSSVYVIDLRGNARTSGVVRRAEGDNVFGQGSRAPVAITVLVRNPDAEHERCRILYHDIGDYLKRGEKLEILASAESVAGIEHWQEITPDRHHDWVQQRDPAFQRFYPIGTKAAKAGKADDAIFGLYSNGYYTGRDAYVYSFARASLEARARQMVSDYQGALGALAPGQNVPKGEMVDGICRSHSGHLRWDATLKARLMAQKQARYEPAHLRSTLYRPFVPTHCYADPLFAKRPRPVSSKQFPKSQPNRAICVPGVGSTKPFSALVVDRMPDLHCVAFGQCFPRYRYEAPASGQRDLLDDSAALVRVDNISDRALRAFRVAASDRSITKDEIFDYVYGLLHAPDYRERFANDLAKGLPRIPLPDSETFRAFAGAGHDLATLHLGYESCAEWPVEVVAASADTEPLLTPGLTPDDFKLGTRAMRFADEERTTLIVNDHVRLTGIPAEAHEYVVNGRTPLEWLMVYYKIATDKRSGIVNDANGWFDDPRDLMTAIRRIVHVSVQSLAIVRDLPDSPCDEQHALDLGRKH